MFTLKDYRKLDNPIRSIAVQHLVAYLLDLYELTDPNELHGYFDWLRKEEPTLPPMPSDTGHFWIDKANGIPLRRGYIIERLNLYNPNISDITIGHPLWQAMHYDGENKRLAYRVLRYVEPELSQILFQKNPVTGTLDRKPITQKLLASIVKFHSMDALAVLLVILEEINPYQSDVDNVLLFQNVIKQTRDLIYRLSIYSPFYTIAYSLYKYIFPKLFLKERYFLRHDNSPEALPKSAIECEKEKIVFYDPTIFFPASDSKTFYKLINMIENYVEAERNAGRLSYNSKDTLDNLSKKRLYEFFIYKPEDLNLKQLLREFYYPVERTYKPFKDW